MHTELRASNNSGDYAAEETVSKDATGLRLDERLSRVAALKVRRASPVARDREEPAGNREALPGVLASRGLA